jgi:RimJ/RimL family protein N-acetyltransferase
MPGDAPLLQEASEDSAVQRYSLSRSRPFTADEAREELVDCESTWLSADGSGRPVGSVVISNASGGDSLGQCGIDGWSSHGDVAQIGYWLTPRARGQGFATRAVVLLTNWLVDLGASRVFMTVVEDNQPSIQVAVRAGYRPEGPTGEQKKWQGRSHQVLCFAVSAREWPRRR